VLVAVLLVGAVWQASCASDPEPKTRASGASTGGAPIPSAIDSIDAMIAAHPVDTSRPDWREQVPRPAPVRFPPDRRYYWFLETSEGPLKIELLDETAPRHVGAMMYLTRLGFFDGLTFHRIIPGFMAQGGDPTGTGSGGPGFRYSGEFPRGAPKHDERGVVSMANAGPRTDGSQFFILFKEASHLNGKHTVFGRVVEGLGTLHGIEARGSQSGEPSRPVRIERAELREEAR
jgi:cyclophilin family peptidyl-prolyl cis-trans isomerase